MLKKMTLALALATTLGVSGIMTESADASSRSRSSRFGGSVELTRGGFQLKSALRFGRKRGRRAPRTYHRHSSCCRVVRHPGAWRVEKVPIHKAGYYQTVTVPARYETHYDSCGNPYQVLVEPASTRRVFVRPHVVYVNKRVWVDAYSEYLCGY